MQTTRGGPLKLWPPLGAETHMLPCGKCVGCKSDRATQWARRCTHESKTWDWNIFITLTYDEENLPPQGFLQPRDLTLFWKRLRKNANGHQRDPHRNVRLTKRGTESKQQHQPIRYFACGEYGEQNGRPHYHAAIFNLAVHDAQHTGFDDRGEPVYTSDFLSKTWGKGRIEFGQFTADGAAYIAQYQMKKQARDLANAERNLRQTGRLNGKPEPFLRMSTGIGRDWFDQWHTDLQHGYLTTNGFKSAIPRYYKERMKQRHQDEYETMELRREKHRLKNHTDRNSPERLAAAEYIHKQKKSYADKRDLT